MRRIKQITLDNIQIILLSLGAFAIDFFMIRMVWRMACCDYEIMIHKDLVVCTWYIGFIVVLMTASVMYLLYKIEQKERDYERIEECFRRDCPEEFKIWEEFYK